MEKIGLAIVALIVLISLTEKFADWETLFERIMYGLCVMMIAIMTGTLIALIFDTYML